MRSKLPAKCISAFKLPAPPPARSRLYSTSSPSTFCLPASEESSPRFLKPASAQVSQLSSSSSSQLFFASSATNSAQSFGSPVLSSATTSPSRLSSALCPSRQFFCSSASYFGGLLRARYYTSSSSSGDCRRLSASPSDQRTVLPTGRRRPPGDAVMSWAPGASTAGRKPAQLLGFVLAAWLALSGGVPAQATHSSLSSRVAGPANNASLRFLVFGDWGGLPFYPYTTRIQRHLAKTMAAVASIKDIDFVLSLGDNFYFKGVRSVNDRRFKRTFEDVYSAPSLQVPWLIVAGNHDHDGNVSAQIEYSKRSKRWHFPSYYYKKSYQIPGGEGATLDILMLDTVLLCGNTDPDDEEAQPVSENRNEVLYNRQFRWINKNLNESKARYILVAGHYPIYSACSHGTTKCLERDLDPLLRKYRVNAYLAGHDHDLQHIRPERREWNVEYFISGCTNFINPSLIHRRSLPRNSLKFAWASVFSYGGFAYMEVAEDSMVITFYDSGGKILHENVMKPRPPPPQSADVTRPVEDTAAPTTTS